VLLAEDNEINALLARAVLERLGHDVSAVEDGASAVAAALAQRFDVILMDLHMPGLDGIAAATTIRRQEAGSGRRTTILGLTADVLAETHAAAITAGIDAVVEKPMTPETLRRALAESLSRGSAAA
jgi:CheY-like chemotaxis protein